MKNIPSDNKNKLIKKIVPYVNVLYDVYGDGSWSCDNLHGNNHKV